MTNVTGFIDRSRLRTGTVIAERPAIITPESIQNRFEGFGGSVSEYAEWLMSQYGQALRSLAYQFRNEPDSSRIELSAPDVFTKKLTDKFDQESDTRVALLQGTDKLWQLSIMKFIIEETLASFSSNVQELQERGFFDGEDRHIQRQHREIQNLIQQARADSSLIPELGRKLKQYGLFEQYQDQFFRLVH